ncbi:unnamed protein product [Protopolystoma xenopodis]|uniref:Cell morphogenesis protein N-terminal domain-containing protein n=1 Tax=Protopolystoma xenopodis TaxID=117903 RepID=A0A448X7E7_9PLAT|nr:unnamed protein product [Protopolystoma xenopodis]
MHPIEEFVKCFSFMQELAQFFLDLKDKEVKRALAGLFVEILLPVAAAANHEVNVPAVKILVEMLYPVCFEMANKKKHILVSRRHFSPLILVIF